MILPAVVVPIEILLLPMSDLYSGFRFEESIPRIWFAKPLVPLTAPVEVRERLLAPDEPMKVLPAPGKCTGPESVVDPAKRLPVVVRFCEPKLTALVAPVYGT